MKRQYALLLNIILFSALAFGCAHRPPQHHTLYIKLDRYVSDTPASKAGHGERVYVKKAGDARTNSNLLLYVHKSSGSTKNLASNVTLALEGSEDLPDKVTAGIISVLTSSGYLVSEPEDAGQTSLDQTARVLYTTIKDFSCSRVGGWTVDDVGRMDLSFSLRDQTTDQVLWSRDITKTSKVVSVWQANLGDLQKALKAAFDGAMEEFQLAISDPDFKNALTAQPGTPVGH